MPGICSLLYVPLSVFGSLFPVSDLLSGFSYFDPYFSSGLMYQDFVDILLISVPYPEAFIFLYGLPDLLFGHIPAGERSAAALAYFSL